MKLRDGESLSVAGRLPINQSASSLTKASAVELYCSDLLSFDDSNNETSAVTVDDQDNEISSPFSSSVQTNSATNSMWEPWLTVIDQNALQPTTFIYEQLILRPWSGIEVYRSLGSGLLPPFASTQSLQRELAKKRANDSNYRKQLVVEVSLLSC